MNNQEFFDTAMIRLGKRKNPDLRANLVVEINLKLEELGHTPIQPWFVEKDWEGQADASVIDLPEDFLCEIEETNMVMRTAEGRTIIVEKKTVDHLRFYTAGEAPGIPRHYALLGDQLLFGPSPKEAYAFTLPYARKSLEVVDGPVPGTDYLLHAKNAMMYTAMGAASQNILQDDDMAQRYMASATKAWQAFFLYCDTRKYTNLVVVGDPNES